MNTRTDLDWIITNTPRESDRSAKVAAVRVGTGAILYTEAVGQRGAKRTEEMGMTNAMRERLIRQLGGTL